MSIRSRLLLLFSLFIIGGLGTITALTVWETRTDNLESYARSSKAQLERAGNYVDLFFSLTANNVRFIAALPGTIAARGHLPIYVTSTKELKVPRAELSPQAAVLDTRLEELVKANPVYGDAGVGFDDGGFLEFPLAAWPAGFDPRVRPWYRGAMAATGETAISNIYITPQGVPVCAVAAKIKDASGKNVGVSYIDIKLSTLVDMISSIRLGITGRVTLIENTGMVIASSQFKNSVFTNVKEGRIPGLENILYQHDGTREMVVDGVARMITVFTGFNNWRFVSVMDAAEVFQASDAVLSKILWSALGVAVLLLVLGYFFARGITRPIALMVDGAEQLAKGNFNAMPELLRRDELGKLHQALRSMSIQLKERLGFAQGIMTGLVTPFVVVDAKGKITYLNSEMLAYWGRDGKPEDYQGKSSGEFFYNDPAEKTPLDKALAQQKVLPHIPSTRFNLKGEKKCMAATAAPLWDMDGKLLGSYLMINDTTEITAQQDRIMSLNARISASINEAHKISNQQSDAFAHLSAQLEKTANAAQAQEQACSATMESVSEMSRTLDNLAAQVRKTAQASEAAQREAEEGSRIVRETVECIGQVAASTSRMEKGMKELGEQAGSINHIVGLIKDIADQTNLLALNAAIEAARAGESGRGFSVVADEVRKLAEKTMRATDDVNSSISSLQSEVSSNQELMRQAVELTRISTENARQSGESLDRIVNIVSNSVQGVSAIAQATEDESRNGEKIVSAMNNISDMARQASSHMNDSAEFVASLTNLAEDLKGLIDTMGKDRREEERYVLDYPAPLLIRIDDYPQLSGKLLNISNRGLRLEIDHGGNVLESGTVMHITALQPPLSDILDNTGARVLWHDGIFCGLELETPLRLHPERDLKGLIVS